MAVGHGKSTKVFFNEFDFSAYFDSAQVPMMADTPETSTFGDTSKSYIPGLKDATVSLDGFFDGSASAVDEEFEAALGAASNFWSIYQLGDTAGNYGYGIKAIETAYSVTSTIDNAVRISAAAQSDSASAERLLSLRALSTSSASDWTGTVFDNTGSSANGGSAYIHVTAATGTIEVKVQHSSDNFAADTTDLISFTAVTGATAERKTVTGTVKQYVRGYATIAGGESISFQLGFYRA